MKSIPNPRLTSHILIPSRRRPEGAAPPTPKRGYYVDFDFMRRSWVEYHSKVAAAAARQENTSTGKKAAAAVLEQLTARMLNTRGVSSFNDFKKYK